MVNVVDNSTVRQNKVITGTTPNKNMVYGFTAFLNTTPVVFDFRSLIYNHRMTAVQGAFFDNTNAASDLIVQVGTKNTYRIPKGAQAVLPIYSNSNALLTLIGSGNIPIILTNFQTPAIIFDNAVNYPVINGYVQVKDSKLESIVSSNNFLTENFVLTNGDNKKAYRAGVPVYTFSSNSFFVLASLGSSSSFLTHIEIYLRVGTYFAASTQSITLRWPMSNESLASVRFFNAPTSLPGLLTPLKIFKIGKINLITTTPGTPNLNCTVSNAPLAGGFECVAIYGSTSVLG